MSSLQHERFSIDLAKGAELVEEETTESNDPSMVWRFLGPKSLFWTVSLHRPDITASLAVNRVFGNVLAQYRQRPAFTLISESRVSDDQGERLMTRVVFRDSVNEPLRVDVVAVDLGDGEVALLQLAVPEWETVDADWMQDALATFERR